MTRAETFNSPRLLALQEELATSRIDVLEAFWQEMATQGTPLIEPTENDKEHMLVTFLWCDRGDTKNVVILYGLSQGEEDISTYQMTHLSGTNIWYKTYKTRSDTRTHYLLSPNDSLVAFDEVEDWDARKATFQIDPLNPRRFVLPADEEAGDTEEIYSILELPEAPAQRWIEPRPDVSHGKTEMFRLKSSILNNERRIWIYTPPNYTPENNPYHILVLFDGMAYIDVIPTPTILDNLLAEGRIPPFIAVSIDSPDGEARERELPCYQPFVDFLTQEFMPWLRQHYHVTKNPQQTIVGGSSYGGLAAAFVGLRASDTFGNVLSQSGSFWWDYDEEEKIASNTLTHLYASSPTQPIRLYLEVGRLERGRTDQIVANCHMRDVLEAKNYQFHYTEYSGGHDYLCWRGSLADGILALMQMV